jgi:hypothetical protein
MPIAARTATTPTFRHVFVVIASDQSPLGVTAPTLTKGAQGAQGFSVQSLKDAGRARVVISFEAVAPAVIDTLLLLVKKIDGVPAAAATTIPVTAGKRLRIAAFAVAQGRSGGGVGTPSLRGNPAGWPSRRPRGPRRSARPR